MKSSISRIGAVTLACSLALATMLEVGAAHRHHQLQQREEGRAADARSGGGALVPGAARSDHVVTTAIP